MSRYANPESPTAARMNTQTFIREGRMCRAYSGERTAFYRELLTSRLRHSLVDAGLVETRASKQTPEGFDLCVEQEPSLCCAPAWQWPAPMLQDAVLFYLQFARRAAAWGIGLLRGDFSVIRIEHDLRPRFTDFTALAPLGDTGGSLPACVNRAMIDPLHLLHAGRSAEARQLIERTCRTVPDWGQATQSSAEAHEVRIDARVYLDARARQRALRERGRFFDLLVSYQREIENLDMHKQPACEAPSISLRPNDTWRPKEHVLHELLRRTRFQTVLDVGCGGGWASLTAAQHGKQVISMDRDENAVTRMYDRARGESLSILPLVWDMAAAHEADEAVINDLVGRTRSDIVLACEIVPHLVFEGGMSFEEIFTLLARMTRRILVVEYVGTEDAVVQKGMAARRVEWYREDNVHRELSRRFRRIEKFPSSFGPERQLLICSDRIVTCPTVSVVTKLHGTNGRFATIPREESNKVTA